MTKLVIDRSKWLRGEGARNSLLLRRRDGKRCCLGFFLSACEVPDEELLDTSAPFVVADQGWPLPADVMWLIGSHFDSSDPTDRTNSTDALRLMDANDTETLSDTKREDAIAAEFAKHGITVVFVDHADVQP